MFQIVSMNEYVVEPRIQESERVRDGGAMIEQNKRLKRENALIEQTNEAQRAKIQEQEENYK